MDYSEKFQNLLRNFQNAKLTGKKSDVKKENAGEQQEKELLSSNDKKFNNNELKKDDLYGGLIVHNEENVKEEKHQQQINKQQDNSELNKEETKPQKNQIKQNTNNLSQKTQSSTLNNFIKNFYVNKNILSKNTNNTNKTTQDTTTNNQIKNNNNQTVKNQQNIKISNKLNNILKNTNIKTLNVYSAQVSAISKKSIDKNNEIKEEIKENIPIEETIQQEEIKEEQPTQNNVVQEEVKEEKKQEELKTLNNKDEKPEVKEETSSQTTLDTKEPEKKEDAAGQQTTALAQTKDTQQTQETDTKDSSSDNKDEGDSPKDGEDNNQNGNGNQKERNDNSENPIENGEDNQISTSGQTRGRMTLMSASPLYGTDTDSLTSDSGNETSGDITTSEIKTPETQDETGIDNNDLITPSTGRGATLMSALPKDNNDEITSISSSDDKMYVDGNLANGVVDGKYYTEGVPSAGETNVKCGETKYAQIYMNTKYDENGEEAEKELRISYLGYSYRLPAIEGLDPSKITSVNQAFRSFRQENESSYTQHKCLDIHLDNEFSYCIKIESEADKSNVPCTPVNGLSSDGYWVNGRKWEGHITQFNNDKIENSEYLFGYKTNYGKDGKEESRQIVLRDESGKDYILPEFDNIFEYGCDYNQIKSVDFKDDMLILTVMVPDDEADFYAKAVGFTLDSVDGNTITYTNPQEGKFPGVLDKVEIDGLMYYQGDVANGVEIDGIMYRNGQPVQGVMNGKYYKNGVLSSGTTSSYVDSKTIYNRETNSRMPNTLGSIYAETDYNENGEEVSKRFRISVGKDVLCYLPDIEGADYSKMVFITKNSDCSLDSMEFHIGSKQYNFNWEETFDNQGNKKVYGIPLEGTFEINGKIYENGECISIGNKNIPISQDENNNWVKTFTMSDSIVITVKGKDRDNLINAEVIEDENKNLTIKAEGTINNEIEIEINGEGQYDNKVINLDTKNATVINYANGKQVKENGQIVGYSLIINGTDMNDHIINYGSRADIRAGAGDDTIEAYHDTFARGEDGADTILMKGNDFFYTDDYDNDDDFVLVELVGAYPTDSREVIMYPNGKTIKFYNNRIITKNTPSNCHFERDGREFLLMNENGNEVERYNQKGELVSITINDFSDLGEIKISDLQLLSNSGVSEDFAIKVGDNLIPASLEDTITIENNEIFIKNVETNVYSTNGEFLRAVENPNGDNITKENIFNIIDAMKGCEQGDPWWFETGTLELYRGSDENGEAIIETIENVPRNIEYNEFGNIKSFNIYQDSLGGELTFNIAYEHIEDGMGTTNKLIISYADYYESGITTNYTFNIQNNKDLYLASKTETSHNDNGEPYWIKNTSIGKLYQNNEGSSYNLLQEDNNDYTNITYENPSRNIRINISSSKDNNNALNLVAGGGYWEGDLCDLRYFQNDNFYGSVVIPDNSYVWAGDNSITIDCENGERYLYEFKSDNNFYMPYNGEYINGQEYYVDGKGLTGVAENGRLYNNGSAFNGIHTDGKLYQQGVAFTGINSNDNLIYKDGLPLSGELACFVSTSVSCRKAHWEGNHYINDKYYKTIKRYGEIDGNKFLMSNAAEEIEISYGEYWDNKTKYEPEKTMIYYQGEPYTGYYKKDTLCMDGELYTGKFRNDLYFEGRLLSGYFNVTPNNEIIKTDAQNGVFYDNGIIAEGKVGNKLYSGGREVQYYNGYDINGYDEQGYNKSGWNAQGINKESGAERDIYGYDVNGYDEQGYNSAGWNSEGINKETGTKYNKFGYSMYGEKENPVIGVDYPAYDVNNNLYTGFIDDIYYENGYRAIGTTEQDGILYKNGEKYTGVHYDENGDEIYYSQGILANGVVNNKLYDNQGKLIKEDRIVDGILYSNGEPYCGIKGTKIENGTLYINGKGKSTFDTETENIAIIENNTVKVNGEIITNISVDSDGNVTINDKTEDNIIFENGRFYKVETKENEDNTTTTETKLLSGTHNGMYFQSGVPYNDSSDEKVYINGVEVNDIQCKGNIFYRETETTDENGKVTTEIVNLNEAVNGMYFIGGIASSGTVDGVTYGNDGRAICATTAPGTTAVTDKSQVLVHNTKIHTAEPVSDEDITNIENDFKERLKLYYENQKSIMPLYTGMLEDGTQLEVNTYALTLLKLYIPTLNVNDDSENSTFSIVASIVEDPVTGEKSIDAFAEIKSRDGSECIKIEGYPNFFKSGKITRTTQIKGNKGEDIHEVEVYALHNYKVMSKDVTTIKAKTEPRESELQVFDKREVTTTKSLIQYNYSGNLITGGSESITKVTENYQGDLCVSTSTTTTITKQSDLNINEYSAETISTDISGNGHSSKTVLHGNSLIVSNGYYEKNESNTGSITSRRVQYGSSETRYIYSSDIYFMSGEPGPRPQQAGSDSSYTEISSTDWLDYGSSESSTTTQNIHSNGLYTKTSISSYSTFSGEESKTSTYEGNHIEHLLPPYEKSSEEESFGKDTSTLLSAPLITHTITQINTDYASTTIRTRSHGTTIVDLRIVPYSSETETTGYGNHEVIKGNSAEIEAWKNETYKIKGKMLTNEVFLKEDDTEIPDFNECFSKEPAEFTVFKADNLKYDSDGNIANNVVIDGIYYKGGIPSSGTYQGRQYGFNGKPINVSYESTTPCSETKEVLTKVESEYAGYGKGSIKNMSFKEVTVPENLPTEGYVDGNYYVMYSTSETEDNNIEKVWDFVAKDGSSTRTVTKIESSGGVIATFVEDYDYQDDFITNYQATAFDSEGNCTGRYIYAQEVSLDGEILRIKEIEDPDGTGLNIKEVNTENVPMVQTYITNKDPNEEYERRISLINSLSEITNINDNIGYNPEYEVWTHSIAELCATTDGKNVPRNDIATEAIGEFYDLISEIEAIISYTKYSNLEDMKYNSKNHITEFKIGNNLYELKYDQKGNLAKIIITDTDYFCPGGTHIDEINLTRNSSDELVSVEFNTYWKTYEENNIALKIDLNSKKEIINTELKTVEVSQSGRLEVIEFGYDKDFNITKYNYTETSSSANYNRIETAVYDPETKIVTYKRDSSQKNDKAGVYNSKEEAKIKISGSIFGNPVEELTSNGGNNTSGNRYYPCTLISYDSYTNGYDSFFNEPIYHENHIALTGNNGTYKQTCTSYEKYFDSPGVYTDIYEGCLEDWHRGFSFRFPYPRLDIDWNEGSYVKGKVTPDSPVTPKDIETVSIKPSTPEVGDQTVDTSFTYVENNKMSTADTGKTNRDLTDEVQYYLTLLKANDPEYYKDNSNMICAAYNNGNIAAKKTIAALLKSRISHINTKNGTVDQSIQGNIGFCWLLSAINTKYKIEGGLTDIVSWDESTGKATVKFKDCTLYNKTPNGASVFDNPSKININVQNFSTTITEEEIIRAKEKHEYLFNDGSKMHISTGDEDVLAIEIAYYKLLEQNGITNYGGKLNIGGQTWTGLELLYGNDNTYINYDWINPANWNKYVAKSLVNDYLRQLCPGISIFDPIIDEGNASFTRANIIDLWNKKKIMTTGAGYSKYSDLQYTMMLEYKKKILIDMGYNARLVEGCVNKCKERKNAGSSDGMLVTIPTTNGKKVTIYGAHVYTVADVDNNSITLRNPHNSSETFTISMVYYKLLFEDIAYIK